MSTTWPGAHVPRGEAHLVVDKIVRVKVGESRYYKERCFALNAASLVDRADDLVAVGGTFGGTARPTPFLCLSLRMLHIAPPLEIVLELLAPGVGKYLRMLAAFHVRLVAPPADVYRLLEPLLGDYRRVRVRTADGGYVIEHFDELVDRLIRERHVFGVSLPVLPPRHALERVGALQPRRSALVDMGVLGDGDGAGASAPAAKRPPSPGAAGGFSAKRRRAGSP